MQVSRYIVTEQPEFGPDPAAPPDSEWVLVSPSQVRIVKQYETDSVDGPSFMVGSDEHNAGGYAELYRGLDWVPFSVSELVASGLSPSTVESPYLFEVRDDSGSLIGTAVGSRGVLLPGLVDYWASRLKFAPVDAQTTAQVRASLIAPAAFQVTEYTTLHNGNASSARMQYPAKPAGDRLVIENEAGELVEVLIPFKSLAELATQLDAKDDFSEKYDHPANRHLASLIVSKSAQEVAAVSSELAPNVGWFSMLEVADLAGRHLMTRLSCSAWDFEDMDEKSVTALDEALGKVDPADLDARRQMRLPGVRAAGRGIAD